MPRTESRLFPALLRHWRTSRGYSQLDLAFAAEVSARHVSFLETGRAQPSREMVLRLASTLRMPLRDQNEALRAAGFAEAFPEPGIDDGLSPPIMQAIERMLRQHEPCPMMVLDRGYNVLRFNAGTARLLGRFVHDPSALSERPNLFAMLFDPRLTRPYVAEWPRVARAHVARLHRETLAQPGARDLAVLLRSLFVYPDVPTSWRHPDFSAPSEATLTLRLIRGELDLSFLAAVTSFDAPQNVTLEELKIESYFPLDDATARTCERLAREAGE